jgi:hypothetical protein
MLAFEALTRVFGATHGRIQISGERSRAWDCQFMTKSVCCETLDIDNSSSSHDTLQCSQSSKDLKSHQSHYHCSKPAYSCPVSR